MDRLQGLSLAASVLLGPATVPLPALALGPSLSLWFLQHLVTTLSMNHPSEQPNFSCRLFLAGPPLVPEEFRLRDLAGVKPLAPVPPGTSSQHGSYPLGLHQRQPDDHRASSSPPPCQPFGTRSGAPLLNLPSQAPCPSWSLPGQPTNPSLPLLSPPIASH